MVTLEEIRIAVIGHIDHGKSTLVGRILLACDGISDERLRELESVGHNNNEPLHPAHFTDQLSQERNEQVTIDTSHAFLRTDSKAIVFIDTPGHRELVGNMLSGAGMADAAILVVDASLGIEPQTCLHIEILRILGIKQIIAAINKMDLVGYHPERFTQLQGDLKRLLNVHHMILVDSVPISALEGDNVAELSKQMAWYDGKPLLTIIDSLTFHCPNLSLPSCFPIQQRLTDHGETVYFGRIEAGRITAGDQLIAWPSSAQVTVRRICKYPQDRCRAKTGECIGLYLDSDDLELDCGSVLCAPGSWITPVDNILLDIIQLSSIPFERAQHVIVRCGLYTGVGRIIEIRPGNHFLIPKSTNHDNHTPQSSTETYSLRIKLYKPAMVDYTGRIPVLNRVLLLSENDVSAVGAILPNET